MSALSKIGKGKFNPSNFFDDSNVFQKDAFIDFLFPKGNFKSKAIPKQTRKALEVQSQAGGDFAPFAEEMLNIYRAGKELSTESQHLGGASIPELIKGGVNTQDRAIEHILGRLDAPAGPAGQAGSLTNVLRSRGRDLEQQAKLERGLPLVEQGEQAIADLVSKGQMSERVAERHSARLYDSMEDPDKAAGIVDMLNKRNQTFYSTQGKAETDTVRNMERNKGYPILTQQAEGDEIIFKNAGRDLEGVIEANQAAPQLKAIDEATVPRGGIDDSLLGMINRLPEEQRRLAKADVNKAYAEADAELRSNMRNELSGLQVEDASGNSVPFVAPSADELGHKYRGEMAENFNTKYKQHMLEDSQVPSSVGYRDPKVGGGQKEFFDPSGYDEFAHFSTNSNVIEEAAGISNKADDLFGIYNPMKDPTQVSGLFGGMADDSVKGVLSSIGIGAGVGMVGSYLTGGDPTEGLAAGGIAGLGIRGISGAINANAAGIQRGMYKSILGNIDGMSDDAMRAQLRNVDKESLNIGQKAMYGVLANPNKGSVGFSLRAQTLTGGFLAGAAFSSRRNDKRRGFNSHRGNRI